MNDLDWPPEWPSDRSMRIGCIGAGFIMSDCHLVSYRQAGLNPVAICSRTKARAQEVAGRHSIGCVYESWRQLLDDDSIEIVDIAVPPDNQLEIIAEAVQRKHVRGILAQKPLGVNFEQAKEIVRLCNESGKVLCVNQNMRYDQSVRACRKLINEQRFGELVLATIDMRAIPHWMPWQQRQGWVTLRIMSIHHIDTFRYWLGDPVRIFASVRPDPRTSAKFPHTDGICLYILEYENGVRASSWDDVWAGPATEGAAADLGIRWRLEGTTGLAKGTIGWPDYPQRTPSTLEFTNVGTGGWQKSDWSDVWFPDAFVGPMAELQVALQTGQTANLDGNDNLKTMALVDAAYRSAEEHRAVELAEILNE